MKSLSTKINESLITEKSVEVIGSKDVIPLRKIDAKAAAIIVHSGHDDGDKKDDVVFAKDATVKVSQLKPAQKEIVSEKAIGVAIGMMLSKSPIQVGGDLGSIISKDNYIMDGHHRWAASWLCDMNSTVSATQIQLNGNSLVSVLNIITKGKFMREGNHGKGDIKDFTGKKIGAILDDYIENGIPGEYPQSPETVKESLGRMPGADGDYTKGKELMIKNADKLPSKIMPGAPSRIDMPVIGPEEVQQVVKLLKDGTVDFTAPYADTK